MTSRPDPQVSSESAAVRKPATLFGVVPEKPAVAPLGGEESLAEETTEERIAKARARIAKGQTDRAVIQGQWERAQKDLARVQVLRERQAEQTKAKLAHLHEALQIAQEEGSLRSQSHREQIRRRILITVAAIVVLTGGVFGAVKLVQNASGSAPVEASAAPSQEPGTTIQVSALQGEFSQGIGRLNQAFSRFPSSDPEAIIEAVNKRSGSSVCAFAWKNGQPALQFGAGHNGSLSVAGTLKQCAEAVEQFR